MLDIKLNTIKFLMTMFDSSCGNSTQVRAYKAQVDELVRRNQLSSNIRHLIYSLYGIENTDVFKPNAQNQKLMQVNMLLGMGEMAYKDNRLKAFKGIVEDGVRTNSILKSARDFIFAVFELETLSNFETVRPSKSVTSIIDDMEESDLKLQSAEVKADIAKIRPKYLGEVYYEYPNPNYNPCRSSSSTSHARLDNSVSRPKDAILVYRKEEGDPCHPSISYHPIPKSWYKPEPKVETKSETKIEVKKVNTPIGDPCSMGGFSRSFC
jgi:hypothetical protein